ncbi:MAG: hypothetical protein JNM72_14360 [Deltaproteobacteria bacterium]|nr:hypothetical protein [Deltaproteobacteria bacterium]
MPILFAPDLDKSHIGFCNGRPCIEFIVTDPDGICPGDFKNIAGQMFLDDAAPTISTLLRRLAAGDGSVREPLTDVAACLGYLDDQLGVQERLLASQRLSSVRPTWSSTAGTWSSGGLLTALSSAGDLSRTRTITTTTEQRQVLSSINTVQAELVRLEDQIITALR